ncbi:hypothetical protein KRE49_11705 [Elizabethkingia meningoseptica]|uniref:hypothetical protein n=1 Tax=Elizabethkingia meningoseptica TaxID=238 RepID=UPI0023B1FDE9|nr:hypothetical protein [Elizabethkingia meningoseptica]MDE5516404.1 hypothetical protein [Elizabethkingia meningoseptica]MDE5526649.1 hypothetical protein [Elizabethkingia meningoseptica]MDN4033738.1 hypothetical protein [Elizabethkingia meningoseptica]
MKTEYNWEEWQFFLLRNDTKEVIGSMTFRMLPNTTQDRAEKFYLQEMSNGIYLKGQFANKDHYTIQIFKK